jgi:Asparagine synthase (glutamine-hydrolyzing)
MNSPMEDRTFFAGVQQLPPGHLLVVSRAHQRVVRYWDIDYPLESALVYRKEADDIEELSATLDEAVRCGCVPTFPSPAT